MTKKYTKSDIDQLQRDVFDVLKHPERRLYRAGRHIPRKDAWAVVKVCEMLTEARRELPDEALPPSPRSVSDTLYQGARGRPHPYTARLGDGEI